MIWYRWKFWIFAWSLNDARSITDDYVWDRLFLNLMIRRWAVKPKVGRTPRAGEAWRLRDGDPFPPKSWARIIDVRYDWVRYALETPTSKPGQGMFDDERKPVESFVRSYDYFMG